MKKKNCVGHFFLARRLFFFPLVLLSIVLLIVLVKPAHGEPASFIINYADATRYQDIAGSTTLSTLIGNVAPRFVIQYANENRFEEIVPIPADLATLLQGVNDRFVIYYANENRFESIHYPAALISDVTAPQISGLTVRKVGSNVVVSWNTNEFATTIFRFGTSPGNLTQEVRDEKFNKAHQIDLGGLTNGVKYYYAIQHVDRSGNLFQSTEYSFVFDSIFLPLVRR